jgi:hypothetical protein
VSSLDLKVAVCLLMNTFCFLDAVFEERLRSQLEMVKEAGELGEFLSSSPPECTSNNSTEAMRLDDGKLVKQTIDPQIQVAVKAESERSCCHLPAEDSKPKELFI